MIITIASGKGGTGKTTIATNLALILAKNKKTVFYLDCDVEEPNGHIFLKPVIEDTKPVYLFVPKVDKAKCQLCGKCGEICQYSAIFVLKEKILTFPDMCHGCRGCFLVCPHQAISEDKREVGVLEKGKAQKVNFIQGRLRIGEAMSPPLIREVKKHLNPEAINIIDAPPGTTCPVIEAVKGSDYVVLVTEPTPFGLNDLKLAVETVRELKVPFGVVINRFDIGDNQVEEYCNKEDIPIIARIPDDRKIAEIYSKGEMIAEKLPEYKKYFEGLYGRIRKTVEK